MTILDACVIVLKESGRPMPAEEILRAVQDRGLFSFGAKDPLSIIRATIRKHLKTSGSHRLKESSPRHYEAA
jgi:restriction system protein